MRMTDPEEARESLSNIEAEQMVLGCLLMNNEAFYGVDSILSPDDFSEGLHQRIYNVITKMIEKGGAASPLTLGNYFDKDPAMQEIGSGYLSNLAANSVPASIVKDHANLVRRLSVRRGLHDMGTEIVEQSLHDDIDNDPEAQIEDIQASLDGLLSKDVKEGSKSFDRASQDALTRAEEAFRRNGPSGHLTGLRCLDAHMGGFNPTDMIVIAGRPGMGKTAIATNISINMSKEGKSGLFFSMEMSADQLAQRIMSAETGISAQDVQRGNISENQYRAIRDAREKIKSLPLEIDERGALRLSQLAGKARRVKRTKGLDYIVVDYMQLMGSSGKTQNNRTNDVTEITGGLKALAKELNVPVIALSQLSRAVEQRAVKRPTLSDLRDSGSIEQDADVILFPYREEYYLRMEGLTEDTSEALRVCAGTADLILAKWRHGPTGDFELSFDASTTTFSDRGHR